VCFVECFSFKYCIPLFTFVGMKKWTRQEILDVYNKPLLELVYEAANVHHQNQKAGEVQVSSLISIKTGGCSEDCGYCPQAAR
jgi:biotin synthase